MEGIKGVDPAPALIAGGEKNISVVSGFSSDSLSWIHPPCTTNTTASPSHPFQSEVRKKTRHLTASAFLKKSGGCGGGGCSTQSG